jgi:transketolase
MNADFNTISMRDAFFERLYELAKKDRRIVLVSADMGAPSLDKFRRDLNSQYVDTGIAEQNAILIATGLALSGKKPYVYAIAPFVTTRIHEFAKLDLSLMKQPITIIGVGAGYSYDDSGPTHHNVEDISIMRVLPNFEVLSPSDSYMARTFADMTVKSGKPGYIRLDRKKQNLKYKESDDFEAGFKEIREGKDIVLVALGNMVDIALKIADDYAKKGQSLGVIDLYRIKPLNPYLKNILLKYKSVVSMEEHLLQGGFGSMLGEYILDNELPLKLKRVGVDDKYNYEYGGREHIQNKMGIGTDSIIEKIESLRKKE